MQTFTTTVSAQWLLQHLGDHNLQILDASWHVPDNSPSGRLEAEKEHIPGALYVDIDEVAASRSEPPYRMMPSPALFAERVGYLGIRPEAQLIVYDNAGLYSAARVWWMFRSMGHAKIAVLDGGLPAWKAAGGVVEQGPFKPRASVAWPSLRCADTVRSWSEVLENLTTQAAQLVDVRSAGMFNGDTSDRYPGVRPGHIPTAINLSQRLLRDEHHLFKSPDEMKRIFSEHGIDLKQPIIATCGSGVTACILALAIELVGEGACSVYDGSWEEWGGRPDLPAVVDKG